MSQPSASVLWSREAHTHTHLIKRPRIGPATLKHLVDDAFGFFPRGAVGVGGDREGGAAADAGLVLLRKVPVSPRELAVEFAISAEVLGADLFAAAVDQLSALLKEGKKGPAGRTSVQA